MNAWVELLHCLTMLSLGTAIMPVLALVLCPSQGSALALLVPRVSRANHHYAPMAANDLAMLADPLHTRLYLHRLTSFTDTLFGG